MDKFEIEIKKENEKLRFEIIDYAHDDDRCKFEVHADGKLLASFEPDTRGYLHICKDPGVLDQATLDLIADKLESISL